MINNLFRDMIRAQIFDFKRAAGKSGRVCAVTGKELPHSDIHIDHVYPLTFDSIKHEFLRTHGLEICDIKTKVQWCGRYPKIFPVQIAVDEQITTAFQELHMKRAVLRPVSAKINWAAARTINYGGMDPEKVREELIQVYPQWHLISLMGPTKC